MSTNDHEERHGEHAEQTKVYVRHEYCVLCAFYVETHVKISINTFRRINAADTRHTRHTLKNTHTHHAQRTYFIYESLDSPERTKEQVE